MPSDISWSTVERAIAAMLLTRAQRPSSLCPGRQRVGMAMDDLPRVRFAAVDVRDP